MIFIAAARLWPQNLGVGKPYQQDIDERLEDWLCYLCYTATGNTAAAKVSLGKIVLFTPVVDNTIMNFLPANHLVSAWAIEKTSAPERAVAWLNAQASLYPGNKIIQWAMKIYSTGHAEVLPAQNKDGAVRLLEQLIQDGK